MKSPDSLNNRKIDATLIIKKGLGYSLPSILATILILMDVLSYGRSIMKNIQGADEGEITNINMSIHLYSTIISQIISSLITTIKGGVLTTPIIEIYPIIQNIQEICTNFKDSKEFIISNTFTCMFCSIIFLAIITLIFIYFKITNIINFLPRPILLGFLLMVGIKQMEMGYDSIKYNSGYLFIILLIIFSIGAYLIDLFLPSIFIPGYIILLIGGIHLILRGVVGLSLNEMTRNGWIGKKESTQLSIQLIYKYFRVSELSLEVIFKNSINMLSIAIMSLIYLPLKLSTFEITMNTPIDYTKEYYSNLFMNLGSSLVFLPTRISPTYSIMFNKFGATNRINSFISSIMLVSIAFYGTMIKYYIPNVIIGVFPFYIGISFCLSSLYAPIKIINLSEYIIMLLCACFCYFFGTAKGIFFGIISYVFLFSYYYLKEIGFEKSDSIKISEDMSYFSINKIILSFNVIKIIKCLDNSQKDVDIVLDFSTCRIVDYTSAILIIDRLKKDKTSNNRNIYWIGEPKNIKLGSYCNGLGLCQKYEVDLKNKFEHMSL
ncbi:hypothetical protein TCON_2355 [Astathelohania contejeani]|uniref:SLC26A/SulP transporter domain-containing protein n=1 Tax=Astathelohania contejeani TaxID=164912 RepID=A0ABQ7HWA3_9MICR|nr:hypothetical protein TCON_2355 [Thelohania contejeani]